MELFLDEMFSNLLVRSVLAAMVVDIEPLIALHAEEKEPLKKECINYKFSPFLNFSYL